MRKQAARERLCVKGAVLFVCFLFACLCAFLFLSACPAPVSAAEVSQAPVYLTYLQLKFHSDRLAGHFTRFHVPLYAGRAMR